MRLGLGLSALALLALSACSGFGNFKPFGTYTYEGKAYDVYQADELDNVGDATGSRFYVLFEQGDPVDDANVIATCNIISAGADLKSCEQKFGSDLRLRAKRQNQPVRDEGGMY